MRLPHILLALSLAAPAVAVADSGEPVRTYGDLTVHQPPQARTEDPRGKMPSDQQGSLRMGEPRLWVGPEVPAYVPIGFDTLELLRLLPAEGGLLAVYREPYARGPGQPGCAAEAMWQNCKQQARFYRADGNLGWTVDFSAQFPRKDHLVVFDTLLDGKTLYYNESCQTYAKDARGKCSLVVAVDVSGAAPKQRWRSAPLVSNAPIVKRGPWLLTGYGFSAEKHYLSVIHAASGKLATKVTVAKSPEVFKISGDVLEVLIYGRDTSLRFSLADLSADGKKAALRLIKD